MEIKDIDFAYVYNDMRSRLKNSTKPILVTDYISAGDLIYGRLRKIVKQSPTIVHLI